MFGIVLSLDRSPQLWERIERSRYKIVVTNLNIDIQTSFIIIINKSFLKKANSIHWDFFCSWVKRSYFTLIILVYYPDEKKRSNREPTNSNDDYLGENVNYDVHD